MTKYEIDLTTDKVKHEVLWSKIDEAKPEYEAAFESWIEDVESAGAVKALTAAAHSVGSPLLKDDHKTTTLGEVKAWLLQCAEQYKKEELETCTFCEQRTDSVTVGSDGTSKACQDCMGEAE